MVRIINDKRADFLRAVWLRDDHEVPFDGPVCGHGCSVDTITHIAWVVMPFGSKATILSDPAASSADVRLMRHIPKKMSGGDFRVSDEHPIIRVSAANTDTAIAVNFMGTPVWEGIVHSHPSVAPLYREVER